MGLGLNYGTEVECIGLGMKYQYNLTREIRFEPSLDYFFKNDGASMFDINANVHYLVPVASTATFYPLAGFTYTNWIFDVYDIDINHGNILVNDGGSINKGKFGVNLGAGIEFAMRNNWKMNFELKYQLISDFGQAVFNIGVAYNF